MQPYEKTEHVIKSEFLMINVKLYNLKTEIITGPTEHTVVDLNSNYFYAFLRFHLFYMLLNNWYLCRIFFSIYAFSIFNKLKILIQSHYFGVFLKAWIYN